jgi:hypothetical protein
MHVVYHVYRRWKAPPGLRGATDEELAEAPGPVLREMRRRRYSLVSSAYHAGRQKLYLGTTNKGGDILVEFDLRTRRFRSCGFQRSGLRGPHDVKIHKGLHLDEAGDRIYFGTASLSPIADVIGKPGGLLACYDIRTGKFHDLGRPIPGQFYQSTCWDPRRGLAYLFTGRCVFAVYDFRRRKLLACEPMDSIPHNGCLDDDGGAWGTYSGGKHAFFRYNPDARRFEFPGCAIPDAAEAADIIYAGAGPVDGMLNGGDGFLYVGTALGELYRLDPRRGDLTFLGKPLPGRRLPVLALGPDGWLYLCGGYRPRSMLARYHRAENRFERLGTIAHANGEWMEYVHEIAVVGRSVYALETDNLRRSGFLWECRLPAAQNHAGLP